MRSVAVMALAGAGCAPGSFEGACVWEVGGEQGCSEVDEEACNAPGISYHSDVHCSELGFTEECTTVGGDTFWCGGDVVTPPATTYSVSFTGEWNPGGGPDPYSPNNFWAEVEMRTSTTVSITLTSGDTTVALYLVDFDDGSILVADESGTGSAAAEIGASAGERFYIVAATGVLDALGQFEVNAQLSMPLEEETPFLVVPEFEAGTFDECLRQHKGCLTLAELDACWPNPCRAHPFDGSYSLSWGPVTCSMDSTVYEGGASMAISDSVVVIEGFATPDIPDGVVDSSGDLIFDPTPGVEPFRIEGSIRDGQVEGTYPANCRENGQIYETLIIPFTGYEN